MRYALVSIFLLLAFNIKAQKVYKTPSGTKYHLATCRMVDNVSTSLTIESALEIGLAPCKICKPPMVQALSSSQADKSNGTAKKTVQCKGYTKSGTRCKHMTSIGNGYCFQHNPDKNIK